MSAPDEKKVPQPAAPAQTRRDTRSMDKRAADDAFWDSPVSDSFYRGAEADLMWRNDHRWEK